MQPLQIMLSNAIKKHEENAKGYIESMSKISKNKSLIYERERREEREKCKQ